MCYTLEQGLEWCASQRRPKLTVQIARSAQRPAVSKARNSSTAANSQGDVRRCWDTPMDSADPLRRSRTGQDRLGAFEQPVDTAPVRSVGYSRGVSTGTTPAASSPTSACTSWTSSTGSPKTIRRIRRRERRLLRPEYWERRRRHLHLDYGTHAVGSSATSTTAIRATA